MVYAIIVLTHVFLLFLPRFSDFVVHKTVGGSQDVVTIDDRSGAVGLSSLVQEQGHVVELTGKGILPPYDVADKGTRPTTPLSG